MGLGNPGSRYEGTRHNVGFEAMDRLLAKVGGSWQASPREAVAEIRFEGKRITLLKPLTFMNLSGGPVAAFAEALEIEPSQILVYYDDVALPLGAIRMRERGSSGGHNGLSSVMDALGGDEVELPRMRIGIRPEAPEDSTETDHAPLVEFVLSRFSADERKRMDEVLDCVIDATRAVLTLGMPRAMSAVQRHGREPATLGGRLA